METMLSKIFGSYRVLRMHALDPISGQNFTANLCFKLLDGDLKVANYVSIIYDYRDKQNFKYAGLMFDGSGMTYAYFSEIKDGKVTVYPPWPGLKTGLRWRFGDTFNLTLSIKGDVSSIINIMPHNYQFKPQNTTTKMHNLNIYLQTQLRGRQQGKNK
jgi:hypothetical protein